MKTKDDNVTYLPQSGSNFVFYALLPNKTYVVNKAAKHAPIYITLYYVKWYFS